MFATEICQQRRLAYPGYDAGLNNHKMSMDIGIALAYLDRRQLVPYGFRPPWRVPQARVASESARQITSIFDLFEVPVFVDLSHLHEKSPPPGIVCNWGPLYEAVFHLNNTEYLLGDEHFQYFRNGRPRIVTLDNETRAAGDVIVDAQTLTTYEYFFYLDDQTARDLAAVMGGIRPKAPYRDLARSVAAAVGRFNAVHIRRGDFVTGSYTPRSRHVSCEEIARNLEEVFDRDVPLCLCTDASELSFFEPLFRTFPRTFLLERELLGTMEWRRRFDELPFNDDHGFSVLVQQIASLAETFVGTLSSSFTSEIQRSRGFRGDQRFLYCYNDWPQHPGIVFERCEFVATQGGPYTWNQIQYPVEPRACSWLRAWPEAFRNVQVGGCSAPIKMAQKLK
jgi:GDP-fucose protein O-fucosyltransferase